jgi:hypothetical protein
MKDYSGWKEKTLNVTSLQLDSKNPRIPELGHEPTQRDIVAELVEHDNVYELAKDISDQGYFPTELLVGVIEDGKDIIVEGNRRLAALKVLLSPELAPEEHIKKFRLLQSNISPETIKKVRVSFAPSREAAAPLIINRHTRTGVERWKPAQQAKYLRSFATAGMSMDDLAAHLGIPRNELSDNFRTDTMYRIAQILDLPADISGFVRNPRTFNASTLERLVQSAKAMEFLGVKFDEQGNAVGQIHPEEFKKAYARMVTDIAQGTIDTRKLNTSKHIEEYLRGFGSDTPSRKRKGKFTSDALLGGGNLQTSPPAKSSGGGGPAVQRESRFLIPSDLRCRLKNPRINDVFRELRRLKVAEFENACAVLLRILLELVVGNYLDRTNKIQSLLDGAKKKGKGTDWYPTLRQMLNAVLADNDIKLHALARKGLNKMVSNNDHPLSLDQLDQFVHNRYVAPTEKELRKLWHLLEDLMQQMLEEPAASPKPTT